jgi:hypothetical protein
MIAAAIALALVSAAGAQQLLRSEAGGAPLHEEFAAPRTASPGLLAMPATTPRMSPDLALETYERRAEEQLSSLGGYSDTTVIEAELPDSAQKGVYELKRHYAAPHTLEFTPVRFVGDGFVKGNVIVRLLQSEAEHVSRGDGGQTAITESNYKFTYKSAEEVDGRPVYVFQVKPRTKRPGLFKGRIFVDAYTASLRRAEGTLVKSPSWFVKKIEFEQDYTDVGGFTLPARLHSVAKARIIGRTIVNILHREYQANKRAETALTRVVGAQ